jgi:dTDP-glucose pyrophosphorylase
MLDWLSICVAPELSILKVMEIINNSRDVKFVLVVDKQTRLLGSVTDGDIRRGILRGAKLEESIVKVMNPNPISVEMGTNSDTIMALMKKHQIHYIPIVDKNKVLSSVEKYDSFERAITRDNFVVIMAGGLGSRLGKLTEDCPKPMLKVGNKPLLERIIDNLKESGFHNLFISVNYKSEIIENYFKDGNDFGVSIKYLREDKKLGTAGALGLLQERNTKPILVMNGDLLTKLNVLKIVEEHEKSGNILTIGVKQFDYQVPYGVVVLDSNNVIGIQEKPVHSFFVSGGAYVFNQDALELIPENQYLDMPTLITTLLQKKEKIGSYPINEYWLDIGRSDDFNKAHIDFHEIFNNKSSY